MRGRLQYFTLRSAASGVTALCVFTRFTIFYLLCKNTETISTVDYFITFVFIPFFCFYLFVGDFKLKAWICVKVTEEREKERFVWNDKKYSTQINKTTWK